MRASVRIRKREKEKVGGKVKDSNSRCSSVNVVFLNFEWIDNLLRKLFLCSTFGILLRSKALSAQ